MMSSSSFTDAINFINPAYNPDVASYFPQPILTSPQPVAETRSVASSYQRSPAPHQPEPQKVVLLQEKSTGALLCDVYGISNKMHILGKEDRKKTKEQNPHSSMFNTEYTEGAKTESVKNIDSDALPGLEEIFPADHALVVVSKDHDTIMLEPSSSCSPDVLKIHMAKHQEFSTSVAHNTSNSKEVDDEIMADNRQSTQLAADESADLMLSASNAYPVEVKHADALSHLDCADLRVCTVCNIFSNSQVAWEKHLAGKTHARKVKYLATLMSWPVGVYLYPVEGLESNTLKLARDALNPSDPSSVVPVGCTEFKETIHTEGGTVISSPNVCTICNIKCNSQRLFEGHLSGRKHASKVRRLGSSEQTPYLSTKDHGTSRELLSVQFQDHDPDPDANFNDASSINLMVLQNNNTSDRSVFSVNSYEIPKSIPVIPPKDDNSVGHLYVCSDSNGINGATMEYYESEATRRASETGKNVYCDVCKVYCNSSETLDVHVMGKKHMKQLEKLGKLERGIGTLAKDMFIPKPVDSRCQQKQIVVKQVEAPKGIINSQNHNNMQETSQDAKFGCILCNVVCNGQMTLSTHLAGRRHAAMLRKTAESEILDSGPLRAASN